MPSTLTILALAVASLAAVGAHVGAADDTAMTLPILPASAADLDALRWKSRPVLVFAPSAETADYTAQRREFEGAAAGLVERDIVVFADTDPGRGASLRRGFSIDGFAVILVGKDGGVKFRADRPVSAGHLFAVIDAMPMRRREMRAAR